jgi:hypothetical protein
MRNVEFENKMNRRNSYLSENQFMEEYEQFIKYYQQTIKPKYGNKSLSIWEYGPKKNNGKREVT